VARALLKHLKMTSTTRAFLTVAALMTSRVAPADEPAPRARFGDRPHAVTGILGAGAPTGMLGIEYEGAPVKWFTISAGAGMGALSPEVATMVRVRGVGESFAMGLGAGASYGGARVDNMEILGPGSHDELHGSVWLNGEAYVERRSIAGLVLRLEVGAGRSIYTARCDHVEEAGYGLFGTYEEEEVSPCSDKQALRVLPFVGFAIGRAF